MKRIDHLFEKVISVENLHLADQKARKRKKHLYGIIIHDRKRMENLQALHLILKEHRYKTSEYTTFTVHEPKERIVYRLPYYPDRIVHHAIMNVLEPYFMKLFTADTYSCIKERGIHGAARAVKAALNDKGNTQHCLKLDIKKFYPSVNHDILKGMLRRKIKDDRLLWLLDEIIDSADGLPIGNYISQYLANFYLTTFDHFVKQDLKVKHYFRYADDIVILHSEKKQLHKLLHVIREYLWEKTLLEVKDNYQVFPVHARGIDFVGYRFYHTHTLLRKSIKQNIFKMLHHHPNAGSMASYYGWLKHCNSINLQRKITAYYVNN